MPTIQFPPIYSHGYIDGDTSKVYEFDSRFCDDPMCDFVLIRTPRYDARAPGARMYVRTANIARFTVARPTGRADDALADALRNMIDACAQACDRIEELGGDSGDWTIDIDDARAVLAQRHD